MRTVLGYCGHDLQQLLARHAGHGEVSHHYIKGLAEISFRASEPLLTVSTFQPFSGCQGRPQASANLPGCHPPTEFSDVFHVRAKERILATPMEQKMPLLGDG
jgi:hypothetical protein